MNIKFQDLLNNLNIGREIEFEYNKKLYSITNSKGYWYLYCDTDKIELKRICEFKDSDSMNRELPRIYIDNKSIVDIFDNLEYDIESLSIF